LNAYSYFLSRSDGSVGMMIGIMMTLMTMAAGGALDYGNAIKKRGTLQSVADASALAAARLGKDATLEEYTKVAQDFFMSTETCRGITCAPPTVTMGENGAVRVEAQVDVPTYILDVVGVGSVPVSVVAEALPPSRFGVDVVMVLDYSGSMGWDDKYISMANAAKDFIDRSDARQGDSMRVGVVPFSEYVLTPVQGQYAFDVAGGADLMGIDIVGCMLNRQFPFSVGVDTPSSTDQGSLWPVVSYTTGGASGASSYSDAYDVGVVSDTTTFEGITYTYEYYEVSSNASSAPEPTLVVMHDPDGVDYIDVNAHHKFAFRWTGADSPHHSLHGNLDWSNVPTVPLNGYGDSGGWETTSDGSLPSDFDAHQLSEALGGSCGAYADNSLWARPLSHDFESMKDAIDKMEPMGATNIALAMDFGWHYLSENAPFTEAATATEAETRKSIVLLSDGTQTVSAHGESGAFNIDSANDNILKTCEAAKAAGVEIYSIAFGIADGWTRNLLKSCSNGDPFYYEPTSGADLEKVFDDIFETISPSKPRLSM